MFANIQYDDRDFDEPDYTWHEQVSRPHVFVNKLRERVGAHAPRKWRPDRHFLAPPEPIRDLQVHEVMSVHSAAEFAAHFDLHLDTHVTIDFGRMRVSTPKEVQAALSQFTKCYAAWATSRGFPPAWIACVEMNRDYEYHAHIALFVPGDVGPLKLDQRRAFRRWACEYTARQGAHVSRAIKVRGGRKPCLLTHWIVVSYLMKGFDRRAILCSGRNSPDHVPIYLGDIVARYYRDPGPVALNRRVSVSNNLGKSRRDIGVPGRLDYLLPHRADWSDLDTSRIAPLTLNEKCAFEPGRHVPTPFRAVIEDGIFDVRRLYPPCFYDFVTKLIAPPSLTTEAVEVEEDLTSYLRRQDFGD